MSKLCAAAWCSNSYRSGQQLSFSVFPKKDNDPARFEKWVKYACRINSDGTPWQPTAYTYLCGEHFMTGKAFANAVHPDYVPNMPRKCDALMEHSNHRKKRTRKIMAPLDNASEPIEHEEVTKKAAKVEEPAYTEEREIVICPNVQNEVKRMEKTRVYMDYQATTPVAEEVVESVSSALKIAWGNPSSSYEEGIQAKEIIDKARHWVSNMINAKPSQIIFTSGGTESNNLVIYSAISYFHKRIKPHLNSKMDSHKPHFITTNIEHDSVVKPLQHFEEKGEINVTYVPVSHKTGAVEVDDIISAIKPTTCLISVMMANNETGILQPIKELFIALKHHTPCNKEKSSNILFHTDAAQAIGKVPVDVEELGVDYLTIVGHKLYGPRNGALYYNSDRSSIYPLFFGGGQEQNLRPGTENTPMIAGLGKAAELVCQNLKTYNEHMVEIRDYLEESLVLEFGDANVKLNGKFVGSSRIPNVCNISFPNSGKKGYEILKKCEVLQASVGAACHSGTQHKPSHVLLAIGVDKHTASTAIRLSVGRDTTKQDVDRVVKDLKQAIDS